MMINATKRPPEGASGQAEISVRGASPPKRGSNKKISRGLIALGATAILAVYSVGYVGTESAAARVATPMSSATVIQKSPSGLTTTATAGSVASATVGYKNGTYVGQGTSRHGGIQVQVVIQGGNIVSAAIIGSSTRYPTSAIASLPAAVVSQQSPTVDLVSGATDSSSAYVQAVASALAQAA